MLVRRATVDLLRQEGQEGQVRMENLDELVNAAQEWADENEGTIADFLDDAGGPIRPRPCGGGERFPFGIPLPRRGCLQELLEII